MNNYKYLAKNIGLLTLSNFGTKFLTFFLLPLYTNILTTEEYGIYDLFTTTIGILVPILTLNIMESVLRFSIDKETNKTEIFSIGLRVFLIGFFLLIVFSSINYIFNFIPLFNDYIICFILLYVCNAFLGIITSFARGLDKIADISIASVISSVFIILFNIIFLIVLRIGILGYFLANIIGIAMQCFYLFIRIKCWNYIRFGIVNRRLKEEMFHYCKPLIANSISWWVNNASDRYIVIGLCGIAENGIYSIGYKIPSILNIFQTIFNQAWVLSAVKDFDSLDSDGFFSKMYNSYNCFMVLICSVLIIFDRFLASILYIEDFYIAWRYVPFLMIAIVFGALSGYIGGIFSAVKNTKIFAKSTVIGAISNLLINVILIYKIGAIGAAIATAISYCIVWLIRIFYMKKMMQIRLYLVRDCVSYVILIVQAIILLTSKENASMYILEVILFLIILSLYLRELGNIKKFFLTKLKHRNL